MTRLKKRSGSRSSTRDALRASSAGSLVVYVHGIGQHEPCPELKLAWDIALFGCDRGPATRMAYWSDIVHPAKTEARARRVRARAAETGADLDPRAILRAAGVDPANKRAAQFAAGLVAELSPRVSEGRMRTKVVPLPGLLRRPIARAFVSAFVGDAAAYFFNRSVRDRIRATLEKQLETIDQDPITLVAHSLGSVVALEVLAQLDRSARPVTLVTIGSPLGLQEVQDFLDVPPHARPFRVPGFVQRWFNFSDPLDPVALDHSLSGEFVVESSTLPSFNALTDEIVINDRSRQLAGFNPHSALGYLAHPRVRRAVHGAAQYDSMSRFVVARDVAESLSVEGRQPVLIEILEPGFPALGEGADDLAAREAMEVASLARARERDTPEPAREVPVLLANRIERAARDTRELVGRLAAEGARERDTERIRARAVEEARIDRLRRFVAAHLTPAEIRALARDHRDLNVYAVWRSASKKKLILRSRAVLQADAALESYAAAGRGITWAVLDTGIRSDHPHFAGRIESMWDCTRPGRVVRLARDDDRDGHGSHVAGIIGGACRLGGQTYLGVAPEARLAVYKVLNDRGEGEDAWIIKALDHIAETNENKASIAIHGLNLSLGGPYDATVYGCGFTPICQELRRLWRSGVLVVVACGNEGQLEVETRDGEVEINTPMSIGDPANLEDCIAVGSVNADRPHLYGVSAFSSRGPTSDGRTKPDVVAPGERITSVNARYPARGKFDREPPCRVDSGTSMAAPHVSGLLAAFLSARREYRGRPDEVKRILLDNCTDLGRDRNHQGRGIPNLMKMLLSV